MCDSGSGKKSPLKKSRSRARKSKLERVSSDITEHRKTQEALRESEERYKVLVGNIPGMVYRGKPDWSVDFISNPEKICGYNVEEFTSQKVNWAKIIDPDDREKVLADASKLQKEGTSTIQEYRIKAKDGTFHWIEDHKVSIVTDTGVFIGVDGVVFDITERKKAEEQLKQSREFLNNTINALDDSFFVKDEEHRWIIFNDAACKAIGHPREELIGKTDYDFFPKEQADVFWEKDNIVLETGRTSINEEEITWQGKLHAISTKKSLYKDSVTGKRFIVGTVRDITERMQMEKTLWESEQKYRALVEQSLFGIVILQDYRIVFANAAAAEIPGFKMEELQNLSLEDMMAFIPPENRAASLERLKNRFAGKSEPGNYELRLVRRNGEEFWLNLFFSNIEFQGKPGIQLAFTDITERKRAEEALRRSAKHFRDIFENTAVGVYRTTPEGRILMANPALVNMLGYSSFEQLGQRNLEEEGFEPQYSRSMFKEEIERKGRIVGWESIWTTRDGKKLYVIENARTVKDEDGGILYYEGTAENITERKKTEEALSESEQRYRAIFEQAADSIVLVDVESGELVEFNDRAHKNLGYSREEFRKLKISDIDVNESAEDVKRHLESVVRTGLDSFETKHRTKEGEIRDILVSTRAISIRDKDFVQSIWYDITDRKKAEEAITESEEKFRNLAEQSPNMIFINKRGRVVYANKQCEEVMGYKREEFYHPDFDFMTLIAPEFIPLIKTNFSRHMKGEDIKPYEYGLITKNGERLDAIITSKLIKYDGEDSILGTITDITERKKAQEEIVKLAKFPAENPNPVLRISKECKILYTNSASSVVLDTWGRKVGERLPKAFCERVEGVFRSGTASIFEFHCHNGQIFEVKLTPIVESGYANAYGLDITERKLAEEKLLEYQRQLKSLASKLTLAEERERRRIAIELHDEISQSLFISKMKLEALSKSPSDKEFNETLDEINYSLGRIIAAMRSLTFDLSSPILYEFGFEDAVAEWLNERVGRKYGIETVFEDDGLPKPLDEDIRVLLFRNVRELLINVVKHARAKKIKVSIQKVGDRIKICVEDDGLGFDSARAESMITDKKAFGLFSIRERLEHLGGNLDIKSSPGCGCRITITSPLKREDINEGRQV